MQDIDIESITIGTRHRKDMGNIEELVASIENIGLLQPIGINANNELIFGYRRLIAFKQMGRKTIPARVIEIDRIIDGEHDENEMRKDFTPTERLAIRDAILPTIQKRHGGGWNSTSPNSKEQNVVLSSYERDQDNEPRNIAARRAGFSSREMARQVKVVVEDGVPALVEAMDKGDITITAAAKISAEPPKVQREILEAPKKVRRAIVSDLRSSPKKRAPASLVIRRPVSILPTLTREERNFPSPEEENLPDLNHPNLTRAQAHAINYSRVQLWPVDIKEAQEARIAARKVPKLLRDLHKPLVAFLDAKAPAISAILAALDTMDEDGKKVLRNKLRNSIDDIKPQLDLISNYIESLDNALDYGENSHT